MVHGTNYRTWDPSIGKWRIRWYEAISSTWQDLEAVAIENGMRVSGHGEDERDRHEIPIEFFDISNEGFRWRRDVRYEGEKTWQTNVVTIDCFKI